MFASVAPRLVDNGYLPIPLNGKRPAINGWNKLKHTEEGLEKLLRQFPKANVGVRTGNLVAIDIDLEEHSAAGRVAALAAEILGFTDFIRVGRWPRRALLYRRSRPTHKQTVGKVEVLGEGQQVAAFGIHPDTQRPYEWPLESILDTPLDQLPSISTDDLKNFLTEAARSQGVPVPSCDARGAFSPPPEIGERNVSLFKMLKDMAFTAASSDDLDAIAEDLNSHFPHSLPINEIEKMVKMIWLYKEEGRLIPSGKQVVLLPFGKDQIIDMAATPEALTLFTVLKSTRRADRVFTIPQQATAKLLGWGTGRLTKAIDNLIDRGLLAKVWRDNRNRGYRRATKYRLLV